ncbi:hypothetical protein RHGRI_022840 [Rhododendron griersonianum]|uniref:Uncharacterized protein n=1 Tax=Rhododendron griersonianum TaxID=479676 RepID=A0AAV6J5G5_9ERIC|nr:hypothetical protein RHGRI_022840 [Rhododendron griersonianum]
MSQPRRRHRHCEGELGSGDGEGLEIRGQVEGEVGVREVLGQRRVNEICTNLHEIAILFHRRLYSQFPTIAVVFNTNRNRAHFDSVIYHPSDTIKLSLDIASQILETSIRSAMCYANGEIDAVVESAGNVKVKTPCASFSNTAICANEGRVRIVGDGAWQKESLKVVAAWVAFDEGNQEIGCIKNVLFCPVVDNIGS